MTHHLDELMRMADDYACVAYAAQSAAAAKRSSARTTLRTAIAKALADAHAEGMGAAMDEMKGALDEARTEMAAECANLGWRTPLDARGEGAKLPLSDEQLNSLWRATLGDPHAVRKATFNFARAVEAAHGILPAFQKG
jgi:hypothetical protein